MLLVTPAQYVCSSSNIGDICSIHLHQIETSIVSHLLELVDESDKNKDGKIDFDEWQVMGAPASADLHDTG